MDLWMPGVKRIPIPGQPGKAMAHNASTKKLIVHSTEGDSFDNLIYHYSHGGYPPHMSWDPRDGRIAQHIPADKASYALLEGDSYGTLCVQIEVVAFALKPFTDVAPWSALKGWDAIHAWVTSLGIPDAWPAGKPLSYPESYGLGNGDRPQEAWLHESGYFCHSQVPANLHGDPGAITPSKLTPPPAPPGGDDMDAQDHAAAHQVSKPADLTVRSLWNLGLEDGFHNPLHKNPDHVGEVHYEEGFVAGVKLKGAP